MKRATVLLVFLISLLFSQEAGITVSMPSYGRVRVQFFTVREEWRQRRLRNDLEENLEVQEIHRDFNIVLAGFNSRITERKVPSEKVELLPLLEVQQPKSDTLVIPLFVQPDSLKKTTVLFMNGINNTYDMAIASAMNLFEVCETELKERYPNELFDCRLAYNKRHHIGVDMMEVYLQKRDEIMNTEGYDEDEIRGAFKLLFKRLFPWGAYHFSDEVQHEEAVEMATEQLEEMGFSRRFVNSFEDSTMSDFDEWFDIAMQSRPTTTEGFIDMFKTIFQRENSRLIIVAHSQGNLYTNDVYDALKEYQGSIGIIHVASPSRRVNGWVWTNDDDKVVNGVRAQDSLVPQGRSNEVVAGTHDEHPWDKRNHNWSLSYFHENLVSRDSIMNQLIRLCEELPYYSQKQRNFELVSIGMDSQGVLERLMVYTVGNAPLSLQANFSEFSPEKIYFIPGEMLDPTSSRELYYSFLWKKSIIQQFLEDYTEN